MILRRQAWPTTFLSHRPSNFHIIPPKQLNGYQSFSLVVGRLVIDLEIVSPECRMNGSSYIS